MSGWTASYRKIWDHPLFAGNALRVGVWQWMIHKAAWKPTRFNANGDVIDLDRGQLCVSQGQICAETGMTRKQLRTFLSALETESAVVTKSANGRANGRTIITICKYNEYQNEGHAEGQQKGQQGANQGPIKEQGNTKQEKVFRAVAERFDDFWEAYPHRGGTKKGKAPAKAKYDRAVSSGVTEQALIDAAKRYTHDRSVRDGYARDPSTWLNQKGWEDEIDATPPKVINGGAEPKYGDRRQRSDGSWQTYQPTLGWIKSYA